MREEKRAEEKMSARTVNFPTGGFLVNPTRLISLVPIIIQLGISQSRSLFTENYCSGCC